MLFILKNGTKSTCDIYFAFHYINDFAHNKHITKATLHFAWPACKLWRYCWHHTPRKDWFHRASYVSLKQTSHTVGFEITAMPQRGILFTGIPHTQNILNKTATLETPMPPSLRTPTLNQSTPCSWHVLKGAMLRYLAYF